jgi:DNA-binding transcriptional MerR regulator
MDEKLTSRNHSPLTPVYNIKAVSQMVGLLPVTLRAWERRYGLPSPQRGDQGYRLYSEQDLDTLRWLKSQIDAGLSISRAVEYLHELRGSGQDPIIPQAAQLEITPEPPNDSFLSASPSPRALSHELLMRLTSFDESNASDIMRRAFALYSVDQVLMEVVTPALVRIGELWHEGKMPIATEHYASQFCMQHLMGMLAASAAPAHPGLILAACAPGETHQIGLLMLVVMLRWRGWNVKYLGPDLKLDGLAEALAPLHPSVLLFTATRPEAANRLLDLPQVLENFSAPKPLVILGGLAFQTMRLPDHVPAIYINLSPAETVKAIENLVNQQNRLQRNPKEKIHV